MSVPTQAEPGNPEASALGAALSRLLLSLGSDGAVERLTLMAGGTSREAWSFVTRLDGVERVLVLRRDPPSERHEHPIDPEARALVAAAEAGVPVPTVYASASDPSVLGAPFILMSHVEGETIARRILRGETFSEARRKLAAQCGRALAAIHAIEPAIVGPLDDRDTVRFLGEKLDRNAEPHPVFELALRWLQRTPPPASARGVVHGDFRLGNLIVGPDGLRAVLDWEDVHLSEPAEDLGWLCVKSWRFGQEPPVGGFGEPEDLLQGYEDGGGEPIPIEALLWWQVAGTLKWGIGCVTQYKRHASGAVPSHELAAIGRRACECEHDLLRLLR